jgi:hypothetical protein
MAKRKGRESNCQLNSQPLKVENLLDLFAFKWPTTYCWKVVNEGYNFALNMTSIEDLHNKLWASKVVKIPIIGILGGPKQNDIWVQALLLGT